MIYYKSFDRRKCRKPIWTMNLSVTLLYLLSTLKPKDIHLNVYIQPKVILFFYQRYIYIYILREVRLKNTYISYSNALP